MEVDGLAAGLQEEADRIEGIAKKNKAREVRKANTEAERMALWKARKQAFGTIGRLGYPSYCTQDGVVPRTKLPQIMRHIQATAKKYNLGICNVFHAGDGNIHPILMFDERDPVQVKKVLDASHEILDECINLGGSVTGEHGIGVEKIDFMPLHVHARRPALHGAPADRVQPGRAVQSGEDAPHRRRLFRAERDRDQARTPRRGVTPLQLARSPLYLATSPEGCVAMLAVLAALVIP